MNKRSYLELTYKRQCKWWILYYIHVVGRKIIAINLHKMDLDHLRFDAIDRYYEFITY